MTVDTGPQVLLEYANEHVLLYGHSLAVDYIRWAAMEIIKLREESQRTRLAMIKAQSLIDDGARYQKLKSQLESFL